MIKKISKEILLILGLSILVFVISMFVSNIFLFFQDNTQKLYQTELANQLIQNKKIEISPDPTLIVPTLGIKAPIIFSKSNDHNQITTDLREGVSHMVNTANPGERGNVFLTGHSSYYFWDKGKYKEVFAHLDGLNRDDLFYLDYNDKRFTYKVIEKRTVLPTEMSVTNQGNRKIATLMTCYPTGTTLKRLIVIGELVE